MKRGEDKSRELTNHTLMVYSGEAGDTVQFAEYIQCNSRLHSIRHGIELSTNAIASFTRMELATSLHDNDRASSGVICCSEYKIFSCNS